MPETLELKAHDHVATLRLNRPESLNAINTQIARAIIAACQRIADDDAPTHVRGGVAKAAQDNRSRLSVSKFTGAADDCRGGWLCSGGRL